MQDGPRMLAGHDAAPAPRPGGGPYHASHPIETNGRPMRTWLQNLSDALVDRLVSKTEAAAATQCWTEETCTTGPLQLCSATNRWMIVTHLVCADGSRTYQGLRCVRCNG
ncbi:hypothetical protein [Streptomyces yaizuensis]|uniref:Uncharacterized protein n=1 Tax=Streptomyces yaizuensis TaxID=2989713 RepID=A0ABQ5PAE0_9ACTN|nr:hypothetical protein [Streptomyces sp. YSPA8]GLF99540.1 hypothetical protein SYYSPA8_34605 [Streptomyces sp. YSPA8]